MGKIDQMAPASGRMLKENDSAINMADMVEAIYKAVCVEKNAGTVLYGPNGLPINLTSDNKFKIDGTLAASKAEVASAQSIQVAGTIQAYNRAAGATQMEAYVESGRVRVRTDGQACTATTGEPIGEGFVGCWAVPSISICFVGDATITVVSR